MRRGVPELGFVGLAASALLAMALGSARSQPAVSVAQVVPLSPGVKAVLDCEGVKPDKAQLACFRRASKLLGGEPAPTTPVDVGPGEGSPERAASSPPQAPVAFGARPPRVRTKAPPPVRQVNLTVRSVGDLGDGRAIFTFTDGSTWRETDPDPILGAVRPGQVVVIAKGVLSGYLLELPHRAVIHVIRMRDDK